MFSPHPFSMKNKASHEFLNLNTINTQKGEYASLAPWDKALSGVRNKYADDSKQDKHHSLLSERLDSGRINQTEVMDQNDNFELQSLKSNDKKQSIIFRNADRARALSVIRTIKKSSPIEDYSTLASNSVSS